MSRSKPKTPYLVRVYKQYLIDEDSAAFIKAVSERYTTPTLERLVQFGPRISRRAAVMALGFLGQYDSNPVLGRALHDSDRGVRILAESGIRELWLRAGSEWQRQRLGILVRLNVSRHFDEAVHSAGELIEEAPWIAEAWNQRAIANFYLERYEDSANDCQQTLELNPYHFGAGVGMARCYLEINDPVAALDCFRRALRLNPSMETVRAQVDYLQRTLEEK